MTKGYHRVASGTTFRSEMNSGTSWIDHVIGNDYVNELILSCTIDYNCLLSDHFPLKVKCNIPVDCLATSRKQVFSGQLYCKLDNQNTSMMKQYSDKLPSLCRFWNHNVICDDSDCVSPEHQGTIRKLYDEFVTNVIACKKNLCNANRNKVNNVPG